MKTFSVSLQYSKSTKGTHVFANETAGLSIYLPKEKFTEPLPKSIKVTFEAEA